MATDSTSRSDSDLNAEKDSTNTERCSASDLSVVSSSHGLDASSGLNSDREEDWVDLDEDTDEERCLRVNLHEPILEILQMLYEEQNRLAII